MEIEIEKEVENIEPSNDTQEMKNEPIEEITQEVKKSINLNFY
jgi:hypothetical protein